MNSNSGSSVVIAIAAMAHAGDGKVKVAMTTGSNALEEDTDDGDFSLSKPTKGWPVGKYHLDIYVNDEFVTTVTFTINAAAKAEKE